MKLNSICYKQEEVTTKEIIVQCNFEEDLDLEFALLEEQFNRNMAAFFTRANVNRSEFERKALILENGLANTLDALLKEGGAEINAEQMSEVEDVLIK